MTTPLESKNVLWASIQTDKGNSKKTKQCYYYKNSSKHP
jgi:hypothetical protein